MEWNGFLTMQGIFSILAEARGRVKPERLVGLPEPSTYNEGRQEANCAMLGPIGMQELIIIFVIALIVFGPRKLPQLGKSLGKSIAEFKRASNELRSTLEEEIRVEETRREIMEPIESIGREAKALVEKAEKAAEASVAQPEPAPAESEETAASQQKA